MKTLTIYGASDDCIEFEGAFSEEYYTYEGSPWFRVTIDNPSYRHELLVFIDYSPDLPLPGQWVAAVGTATDLLDVSIDVTIGNRYDRPDDPAIIIHLQDPDVVSVKRL